MGLIDGGQLQGRALNSIALILGTENALALVCALVGLCTVGLTCTVSVS